jgi:hypothetical protein
MKVLVISATALLLAACGTATGEGGGFQQPKSIEAQITEPVPTVNNELQKSGVNQFYAPSPLADRQYEQEIRKVNESLQEYRLLVEKFEREKYHNVSNLERKRIDLLRDYETRYREGRVSDFDDLYRQLAELHRHELDIHPREQEKIRRLQEICAHHSSLSFRQCLYEQFLDGELSQDDLELIGEHGLPTVAELDIERFYDFWPHGPDSSTDMCTADGYHAVDILNKYNSFEQFENQYHPDQAVKYPWKEPSPETVDWINVYDDAPSLKDIFKRYPSRVVPGLAGGLFNPDWCLARGECEDASTSGEGSSWHPWPKNNQEQSEFAFDFFRWWWGDGIYGDSHWTDFAAYLYMDWSEYKWLDGSYRAEFHLSEDQLVGDHKFTSGLYGNEVYLALIFNTGPNSSFDSSDIYSGETGFCDPKNPNQFSQMAAADGTVTCGDVTGSPDTMFVLSDGTGVLPGLQCDSYGMEGECIIDNTICRATNHAGHQDMPHKPAGFDLHIFLDNQNFEVYEFGSDLFSGKDKDTDSDAEQHRRGDEPRISDEPWVSTPADISSRPGIVSLSGEVQCRTTQEWGAIEEASAQCDGGLADPAPGIAPEPPEFDPYAEDGVHYTLFVHGRSAGRSHCNPDPDHDSHITWSGVPNPRQARWEWSSEMEDGPLGDGTVHYWNRYGFPSPHEKTDQYRSLGEVRYVGFDTEALGGAYSNASCGAQKQLRNALLNFCLGNNTCDIFTHSTGSLVVSRFVHDNADIANTTYGSMLGRIERVHFLASAAGGSELASANAGVRDTLCSPVFNAWAAAAAPPPYGLIPAYIYFGWCPTQSWELDQTVSVSGARSWNHNITNNLLYETSSGTGPLRYLWEQAPSTGPFCAFNTSFTPGTVPYGECVGGFFAQTILKGTNDRVVSNHSLCNLNAPVRTSLNCEIGNSMSITEEKGVLKKLWDVIVEELSCIDTGGGAGCPGGGIGPPEQIPTTASMWQNWYVVDEFGRDGSHVMSIGDWEKFSFNPSWSSCECDGDICTCTAQGLQP